MHQIEDAGLVEAVLAGDKDAYAHLLNRYKRPIFNLAYRMTLNRDIAQDLAQETFVRAYANLHRYDPELPFLNWLYTLCLNLTRNHLSKKREVLTETGNEPDDWEDHDPGVGYHSPESQLIEQQEIKGLERVLRALPEELRETIVLRYVRELPFESVASILGVSMSATKMRVYRGLEKMRELMTGQRDDHEI
jgi:RNA polymerase sigma factor (sigma-70 family)